MNDASTGRGAALAGEALVDLIRRGDGAFDACLGGAVYNLARALARQGVAVDYLNPLSRDRFGQALAAQLRADGVRLAQREAVAVPTALAVVDIDGDGHPAYAFYRDGVADRQVSAASLTGACAGLPALGLVATGGLALDPRDAAVYLPWLQSQAAAGRCIVVDANLRPSVMSDLPAYRQQVLRCIGQADLVKVSDEDLQHLQIPGTDALAQAENLLQSLPHTGVLALTLGAGGAWLLQPGGPHVHARETEVLSVVDTVGAGDSFLAGLLACLLRQAPGTLRRGLDRLPVATAQEALRHAVASASCCVLERGCVPPSWAHTKAWCAAHAGQLSVRA